jgi:hypothetical protein
VNDLQLAVASAADQAEAHSTAPALLLAALTDLGQLAQSMNRATDGGRLPFRIPPDWHATLGQLAYTVFLMADQTAVDIDQVTRQVARQVVADAAANRAHLDEDPENWFARTS